MRRFYVALLPWAAFDASMRSDGLDLAWGASLALGMGVTVFALNIRPRRPLPLDMFALVLFTTLLVSGLATGSGNPLGSSARSVASLALGAFLLLTARAAPDIRMSLAEIVPPRR